MAAILSPHHNYILSLSRNQPYPWILLSPPSTTDSQSPALDGLAATQTTTERERERERERFGRRYVYACPVQISQLLEASDPQTYG